MKMKNYSFCRQLQDWIDNCTEWIVSLEIDQLLERQGPLICVLFNILFLLLKWFSWRDLVELDLPELQANYYQDAWNALEEYFMDDEGSIVNELLDFISNFGLIALLLEYSLLLISIVNTVYLFAYSFKEYVLFKHAIHPTYKGDTQWQIKSPNARLKEAVMSQDVVGKGDSLIDWIKRLIWSSKKTTSMKFENKWHLNVWHPQLWNMQLFCWFSPVHLLLLEAADVNTWQILLPISFGIGFMLHTMSLHYNHLLKDKDILSTELLSEFTNGFVYKQAPFREKKDVFTMTQASNQ